MEQGIFLLGREAGRLKPHQTAYFFSTRIDGGGGQNLGEKQKVFCTP